MDNVPPTPPQPPYGQPPFTPPPGQPPGAQYPGYPGQPPPKQRGWFARNWLWFIPVGCLTPLVLLGAFVFGIISLVFGAMKSSDAYKTSVARAKANPEVIAALGTPIDEPYFFSGQINGGGDTGTANLTIPVSGPKGGGTIFVNGDKSGGVWRYSKMYLHADKTNQDIDLRDPEP